MQEPIIDYRDVTPNSFESGLSLGTNQGDRMANLMEAARLIESLPETQIIARSMIYETAPVGVKPQYRHLAYLNAVLIVSTALEVEELSSAIHDIESAMGRVRTRDRFAPRIIDIDILYVGDRVCGDEQLTLPHPRWAQRRFVVQPLCDVRPDLVLPGSRKTVNEILGGLQEPATDVRVFPSWWGGEPDASPHSGNRQ